MVLHIGENNYIFKSDIIAILDRKSIDSIGKSREFINSLIEDKCIIGQLDCQIKSYILASRDDETVVYTSNISSKALANRNI